MCYQSDHEWTRQLVHIKFAFEILELSLWKIAKGSLAFCLSGSEGSAVIAWGLNIPAVL